MSTNYYYLPEPPKPPCESCGRAYDPGEVHVGKSAMGWKFSLAARDRSDTWGKIKGRLQAAHKIWDEYGVELSAAEMIETVEEWQEGRAHCDYYPEHSWRDPEGYVMNEREFS